MEILIFLQKPTSTHDQLSRIVNGIIKLLMFLLGDIENENQVTLLVGGLQKSNSRYKVLKQPTRTDFRLPSFSFICEGADTIVYQVLSFNFQVQNMICFQNHGKQNLYLGEQNDRDFSNYNESVLHKKVATLVLSACSYVL